MNVRNMIEKQIKARGITDQKVISALETVKRHKFVPEELRDKSYGDYPLCIGEGQTISQPYIVSLMTEILDLNKTSKILEVGTGSGYQTAVLAEIGAQVYSIERIEILARRAEKLLDELGYLNISIKIGDGALGWIEYSPFDAIVVTCAATEVPLALKEQLAEGGKMIIPVGDHFFQELVLLTKTDGYIKHKDIISVRFVPMVRDEKTNY